MDKHGIVGLKSAQLEAVIIRKDGTREDLGVISYWNRNPLRRLHWHVAQWLRGKRAGQIKLREEASWHSEQQQ